MSSDSTPYYKLLDFSLLLLSCVISFKIRFGEFGLPIDYFLPSIVIAVTALFSLQICNLYISTNSKLSKQTALATGYGLATSAIATASFLYFTKTGEDYSRLWFAGSILIGFFSICLSRYLLFSLFQASHGKREILVLANPETAATISRTLRDNSAGETSIATTFAANFEEYEKDQYFRKIANYIEQHRLDSEKKAPLTEVWVAPEVYEKVSHFELKHALIDSAAKLIYIAGVPKIPGINFSQIVPVAGIPTINSDFGKSKKFASLIKFIEDQLIAWPALILLSPLFLIIAIAIKLGSAGPVFYRQKRYGFGGKEFTIWKFRTMTVTESSEEFKQATKDDARVTRLGKFLRRTSLDELPQLINVINGTMSIVGPRPHPNKLNETYRNSIDQYMFRHSFKPGLTGLAQINGFRGETADTKLMEDRIRYDLEYINDWSLLLDIKIVFLTLIVLLKSEGAY